MSDLSKQRLQRAAYLNPVSLLIVFIGSAVGTSLRVGLGEAFHTQVPQWPWTTLLINLSGSLVLGFVLELLDRLNPQEAVHRIIRLGLGTGVIGGYTTYSAFAVEVVFLGRASELWLCIAYAGVSVVLGLLAVFIGIVSARYFVDPDRKEKVHR
jgi:CrcB protein